MPIPRVVGGGNIEPIFIFCNKIASQLTDKLSCKRTLRKIAILLLCWSILKPQLGLLSSTWLLSGLRSFGLHPQDSCRRSLHLRPRLLLRPNLSCCHWLCCYLPIALYPRPWPTLDLLTRTPFQSRPLGFHDPWSFQALLISFFFCWGLFLPVPCSSTVLHVHYDKKTDVFLVVRRMCGGPARTITSQTMN